VARAENFRLGTYAGEPSAFAMADVPARTAESDAMSRDLLRHGFKFVGSTICYALMQATGMVNDHLVTCPRHAQLGDARRRK